MVKALDKGVPCWACQYGTPITALCFMVGNHRGPSEPQPQQPDKPRTSCHKPPPPPPLRPPSLCPSFLYLFKRCSTSA